MCCATAQNIEAEIGKVEESITEGSSDSEVEEEVGGIVQQINAFKSLLGF